MKHIESISFVTCLQSLATFRFPSLELLTVLVRIAPLRKLQLTIYAILQING